MSAIDEGHRQPLRLRWATANWDDWHNPTGWYAHIAGRDLFIRRVDADAYMWSATYQRATLGTGTGTGTTTGLLSAQRAAEAALAVSLINLPNPERTTQC